MLLFYTTTSLIPLTTLSMYYKELLGVLKRKQPTLRRALTERYYVPVFTKTCSGTPPDVRLKSFQALSVRWFVVRAVQLKLYPLQHHMCMS